MVTNGRVRNLTLSFRRDIADAAQHCKKLSTPFQVSENKIIRCAMANTLLSKEYQKFVTEDHYI